MNFNFPPKLFWWFCHQPSNTFTFYIPYSCYYKLPLYLLLRLFFFIFVKENRRKLSQKHHKKPFWCGFYSRGASIQERLIIARIRYIVALHWCLHRIPEYILNSVNSETIRRCTTSKPLFPPSRLSVHVSSRSSISHTSALHHVNSSRGTSITKYH